MEKKKQLFNYFAKELVFWVVLFVCIFSVKRTELK